MKINDKQFLTLIIIYAVIVVGIVAGMIIYARTTPKDTTVSQNCWDKYQTEDQAILHCETHKPIIGD